MIFLGIGGIHSGALLGAVIVLASSVWLAAGSSRFAAVLAGRTSRQVKRATAIGFFSGLLVGFLILVIDLLA